MSSRYRVLHKEIAVGQPLKWDVYDANGTLLLRRGYVIDSERSLLRLIEQGLFLNGDNLVATNDPQVGREEQRPSTLQYLMDVRRLLSPAAQGLDAVKDFSSRIRRIAELVDLACQANRHVAVASILLLQDDSYAVRHHVNAAIVANLLAHALELPQEEIDQITAAALTMNVSMVEVHDKLNDIRTPLNERLRALINSHPAQSGQRLRRMGINDDYWLACVEQHHERENGSGYPLGLTGPDVVIGAKIVGLADRYCARISNRKYRPTQPPHLVLRDLYIEKGQEIDTVVAAHLLRIVGLYPPGTIVRLRNGEIAVVTEPTDDADTPIAYAVLGPSGAALAIPTLRKTAREAFNIIGVLPMEKLDFPIQMSRLWGDAARLH